VELASRLASGVAWAIGALALIGWLAGLPALASFLPGARAMNPVTAFCVVLLGGSLWMKRRPDPGTRARWLARTCVGLAMGLAALRLVSPLAGIETGAVEAIHQTQLPAWTLLCRMGLYSSVAILCLGAGLLTLDFRTRGGRRVAEPFLYAGTAIPLMTLTGYIYSASAMHGVMAFNTGCALILLSTGSLLARPERGLCGLLLSSSPGGAMARRVLPAAIVVPLVLGWLRLAGQHAGLYGLEIGTTMLALAIVLILVGLVSLTGRSLDAADDKRRRAEEALRTNVERQSLLLDTNLIGVLTTDVQAGLITDANAAFLEIVGYTREDLPLKSEAITPPEWHHRTDVARHEIVQRSVATPFEKEYVRKDGTRVPVLIGAAAVGTGEAMAFVVDLRGKKLAELEIERMRLFLDSIVENLPNMVFVKDAKDLRFVQLNRAGEELLGLSRQALLDKNDYDFFPKEEADFFTAKDRLVLSSRQLVDIPEETIQTSGGEARILHTKKVPLFDREGVPQYLLGISEDITERKQVEREVAALNEGLRRRTEELEAANKELEAFSYSVSHDLRAPLRHIDGFADLLARQAGSALDEKGRRYLDTISNSAKSMGRLIDDLLAFSRMSRTQMHRAEVNLGYLIAEVRRNLEQDVAGRDVAWTIGALPTVHGDAGMLRLVFMNLLANAVKYSGPREHAIIEVGAHETEAEWVVFVRDNGVGFDMNYVHKLFGVFQRLHSDSEFEGTGIGLANVRRVIHRHGGRTWAEGVLDAGATFYVSLPRLNESPQIKEAA
jgi:PAS domain S-box-containing protein